MTESDRRTVVHVLGAVALVALLGAITLYVLLLRALGDDSIDAAELAVIVGAVAGLVGLAGTCVGVLAPSPLSKSATSQDVQEVAGPGGGPVLTEEAGHIDTTLVVAVAVVAIAIVIVGWALGYFPIT